MSELQTLLLSFFNDGKFRFFERETENIIDGISERNLCGRLSTYLEFLLEKYNLTEYYSDTEYNRKQNGEVKTILDDNMEIITINCDLIVHSRGSIPKKDNLLAIEMKKSTRPEYEKISDKKRLRTLTKSSYDGVWSYDGKTHPEHVCGYELGIYIELDIENRNCIIEGFLKGEKSFEQIEKF
jgi:hypothetical protein